jgi:hypothetical protein
LSFTAEYLDADGSSSDEQPPQQQQQGKAKPAPIAQTTRSTASAAQQVKKAQGTKKWEGEDDDASDEPVVRPSSNSVSYQLIQALSFRVTGKNRQKKTKKIQSLQLPFLLRQRRKELSNKNLQRKKRLLRLPRRMGKLLIVTMTTTMMMKANTTLMPSWIHERRQGGIRKKR